MANAIADPLEETAPMIVKQVEDAEKRERERQAQAAIEARRRRARERHEARKRARQTAKEELRSIVRGWNDAFATEAFFNELSRRAAALGRQERAELEARIETAPELMGGKEAVERFLLWKLPPAVSQDDEEAGADDDSDDDVVENDG